jgi:acetate kinase
MNILVINAGSSSLKFQLIHMNNKSVMACGVAERIGKSDSVISYKFADKSEIKIEKKMRNHNDAMAIAIEALTSDKYGAITSISKIDAVGHRIVHGGEKFSDSVLINDDVLIALKDNIELAPLHNPTNIMGIEACKKAMSNVPMVAVFDTAFHQTMPQKAYLYGLPYEVYTDLKIRRYGFHGISHKYLAQKAAKIKGKDIKDLKIITCHLGNGASVAAIKNGESIDTSMGFTPLEGLIMGTRCGDIDPAIVDFLMKKRKLSINEVNSFLNTKSGVLGISGKSNDFRDLHKYAKVGDERSIIAIEAYCYRVKKYIGSYIAVMNGVDAIVFGAGVGENDTVVRAMIMEDMEYQGVKMNLSINNSKDTEKIISKPESKVIVMVVPTNEELMIANETYGIIKTLK